MAVLLRHQPKPKASRRTQVTMTEELLASLGAYAERKGVTLQHAIETLLDAGLRSHARAVKAGTARGAQVTPEQARSAIRARWDKRQP